jgi:NhaP-type Na+/H+ or K+/H+ antiporter
MIFGIAEIIIAGLVFDWIFTKLKMPGLIGLLVLGLLAGPFGFSLLNPEMARVSHDLRMLALVVILLRAGFEISRETLTKVGFRALLMSFVPCLAEVATVTAVAPLLLPLTTLEAAILGSILAAVSPAVVVPLMIQFIQEGRGMKRGAPTLILAGSSCDDAVAIVLCSSLTGIYIGNKVNVLGSLAGIPISVITGFIMGGIAGIILHEIFRKFNPRATKRAITIIGLAIVILTLQSSMEKFIPFAPLIAIMSIGFIILEKNEHMAHEISSKLGKIWVFAQLLLFTLVGAKVNIPVAMEAGLSGVAIILLGLTGRSLGVQLSLLGSDFTFREKLFATISYLPKATVQAAIGGAPLAAMAAAGMDCRPGEIILAIAVMSIVITAPPGALLIAKLGPRLLGEPDAEHFSAARQAACESQ